jgi:hypothetical protein
LAARAQSVALDVCNTGAIDIDVFVSSARAANVTANRCADRRDESSPQRSRKRRSPSNAHAIS